ncbi:hypothetical protein ACFLTO_06230 [Chloroflexota bacterium]
MPHTKDGGVVGSKKVLILGGGFGGIYSLLHLVHPIEHDGKMQKRGYSYAQE